MEYSKEQTVCFTGHRPKKILPNDPYNPKNHNFYQSMVDRIYVVIEKLYDQGYRKYITGGAQGFDQLAFWAVNRLKKKHPEIQNVVYLPFQGYEDKWAESGMFSKTELNKILSLADDVRICSKNMDPKKDSYKTICVALNQRNHDMVDDSTVVVAQIDVEHEHKDDSSGTMRCAQYAINHNKKIIVQKFY